GGRAEYALFQLVTMLRRASRAEPPSHRQTHQANLVELQLIEKLQIVEHVVVDRRDRGAVGRLAKARMIRQVDPELPRPRCGKIEARYRAGAVQKYQRLAGAPCEQHDVGAVDPNLLPFEAGWNLRRL